MTGEDGHVQSMDGPEFGSPAPGHSAGAVHTEDGWGWQASLAETMSSDSVAHTHTRVTHTHES